MRIDTHTHIFHPKTAQRLFTEYDKIFNRSPAGDGSLDMLETHLHADGFTHAVILNAALSPWQVESVNSFTIMLKEAEPWLIPFGAVHPADPDWEKHLEQLRANGIKGIKLHPEFQNEHIDDPRFLPILEAMGSDFVCTIHMGRCHLFRGCCATPAQLARLARDFPSVRFVAAHMGGHNVWEEALDVLHGKNVYLDTAFSLPYMPKNIVQRMFKEYPRENILFGSDWPFCRAGDTVKELRAIAGLSEQELWDLVSNANALFNMT